ncbi:LLM class flavin-dependent oxidoreductase [Pseudomonas sp. CR3202]|uniref:LLM class flavin-dependent oxidoreductase n=1 Tax=Pseudomonas sp. CR3202 TaxID=3351532 RepID=UPI003BF3636C
MSEFIWQLPNDRDARYADATPRKRGERLQRERAPFAEGVSDPRGNRFNYIDYLHQVARAAELTGFDGIRIRNTPEGDEPWILAGYLAAATRRLKLIAEFDAARGSAVYAAKNAISFQRFSGNRFAWQIGSVADPQLRRRLGDRAQDADLLPRIDEFLSVARGVIGQTGFNFKGRFFEVQDGGFSGPLGGHPAPQVYLSGDSAQALQLSAAQADVHLFDIQPLDRLAQRIEELAGIARSRKRELKFGLRVDLLARESQEEAEFDARRLAEQTHWQGGFDKGGLWLGLNAPHTDARATLVGSYEQIAERLSAYAEAGIHSFLLGGAPHLEEAYRVGENLLPKLRTHTPRDTQVA